MLKEVKIIAITALVLSMLVCILTAVMTAGIKADIEELNDTVYSFMAETGERLEGLEVRVGALEEITGVNGG